MNDYTIFATLSPTRLFVRCAVPGMVSMAVTSLYMVADGIFVGAYLGANALAAMNLVMPFIMMSFAVSDMIAVGSSVQISIRLGRAQPQAASQIFTFCSMLIVGISCVMGLAAYFFAVPLMHTLGADDVLTGYAIDYMRVYALFSPVIMIFFAVDNYLRACGWIRYSMIINVVMSLLNIALDWLFLAHFGWGISSAALASCLSLTLGTCAGFAPFVLNKTALKLKPALLSFKTVLTIIANGSSEFFSNISASAFMVIANLALMRLSGAMAVAAFSIVLYVNTIVSALLFGMADSMQPAISYNYGAGNHSRMLALLKRLMFTGAVISLGVMFFTINNGNLFAALFVKDGNTELIHLSGNAMKLFALSYLTVWFGVIAGAFFTALNMAGISLMVAFSRTLIFPILVLTILVPAIGLDGVWLTRGLADILTAVLAALLMLKVIRQKR